jgi:polyisoprenoid-binding protein YceI
MRIRSTSLVLFATLALSANAFAAKAEKKAETKTAKAGETKVGLDPAASVVKWEGKKVTGQHEGEVKLKSGELILGGKDGKELKGGEVLIDMTTIANRDIADKENNAKLVGHLKSDDFFDVAKYPTSTLKIKKVKAVEGLVGPTYEVTGDLTVKGKTHEVKFPAVVETKDGKTTAKANLTLDRTKWDVRYGSGKFFQGLGDKMINDEFKLDVNLASK